MAKRKASSYSNKSQEYFWKAPIGKNQREFLSLMDEKQLVFAHGPAGTGKTMFALQTGLKLLDQRMVDKIYYVRNDPFDKLGGVQLGALPGNVDEKMGPLLGPIMDNLDELCSPGKAKYIVDNGLIETIPIRFLLGRSLANAFIIVDEAQNCPPVALELIVTRVGRNSQMVILGSDKQKTSQDKFGNGMKDAMEVLQHVDSIGIVQLTRHDIQRSELVADIAEAYEKRQNPFQHLRIA